ncbi:MAG TPA: sensor histidine kinase, partial [Anaerolineales bacterium]|nr:sensor histidine kinase [Anaerolineales bacterium]
GNWVFIATVVAGYLSSLVAGDWQINSLRTIAIMLLGVAYCVIGTVVFDFCPRDGSPRFSILYFAIQIALVAAIFYLSDLSGFFIIIVLPLVSHSILLLPRTGAAIVCALLLLLCGVVVGVRTSLSVAIQATLSMAAGFAFVAVFTELAMNEQRARAEVERLAAELTEANQKLREYAAQVEELATVRERNRLAREIHDGLGHYLTVVNMQIQAARAVQASDPARAAEAMGKAGAMAQEALADVRRSVAALRASPTENKSLPDTLRALTDEIRASGIAAEFTVRGSLRPLSPPAELTLYRAAQEALTNVRKHAHASAVEVALEYGDASARLAVRDNGVGSDDANGGFGLVGVRERALLLNGQVMVSTAKGEGFRLEIELPVDSERQTVNREQ